MRKKRALTSEAARKVRQKGHDDALEFALAIGLKEDYKNDLKAKKDVIDPSGDAHSVKSGEKKWQIFLYSLGRFDTDEVFGAMNGIGDLFRDCINSFPPTFKEYQKDKPTAKNLLRKPMTELAHRLKDKKLLRAFLSKSLFNSGEINYLTVRHEEIFHVFLNTDVLKVLCDNLEICNSKAITVGQLPEQKVLFRYKGKNLGELEMRNDSEVHYREVRFNMLKPKIMGLLFEKITVVKKLDDKVLIYGKAAKRFGRWNKSS